MHRSQTPFFLSFFFVPVQTRPQPFRDLGVYPPSQAFIVILCILTGASSGMNISVD